MKTSVKSLPINLQRLCGKSRLCEVDPRGVVTLSGAYWSGGSRYYYARYDIHSGRQLEAWGEIGGFGSDGSVPTIEIQEGECILRTGTFCGKPSRPTFFVNPADIGRFTE